MSQNYLTPREQRTLEFIARYRADNKISPTFVEIAKATGISKSRAKQLVEVLWRKCFLVRRKGVPRSIVPVSECDSLGK